MSVVAADIRHFSKAARYAYLAGLVALNNRIIRQVLAKNDVGPGQVVGTFRTYDPLALVSRKYETVL